ncbi:MAG TPA: phosphate uptake regulator PhoU [Thermoplasmatales archaeon]|nr:phosphate uptake regulator PhoU [Thermoplasmatales archaeon]
MEIRKIQVTGGASFIVSLPKDWARAHGVKKNDRVGIIDRQDGTLLLTTKTSGEQIQRTKDIDITKIEDTTCLFRMLLGAYIRGYNVFHVTSDRRISPAVRETLRRFIHAAIGLEIIEETSTSLTVKDLLDPGEMPFDKAIRRITSLVSNMHKDALFALAYGDQAMSQDVITRDDEVDRLHWLISRQYNILSRNVFLAESMKFSAQQGANYSLISRTIERIGDHAVTIATNNLNLIGHKLETPIMDTITKAGNFSLDMFTDSVEAFFNRDILGANKNIDTVRELKDMCEEIEGFALQQTGAVAVSLGYIGESIRRVGEYSADLAEYVINYLIDEA